jgi:hypothetical protein
MFLRRGRGIHRRVSRGNRVKRGCDRRKWKAVSGRGTVIGRGSAEPL